ncbi:hypothetical protein [Ruminococcus callidus]|nr:hypothetical protein [Ruminococcus callidus]
MVADIAAVIANAETPAMAFLIVLCIENFLSSICVLAADVPRQFPSIPPF